MPADRPRIFCLAINYIYHKPLLSQKNHGDFNRTLHVTSLIRCDEAERDSIKELQAMWSFPLLIFQHGSNGTLEIFEILRE